MLIDKDELVFWFSRRIPTEKDLKSIDDHDKTNYKNLFHFTLLYLLDFAIFSPNQHNNYFIHVS